MPPWIWRRSIWNWPDAFSSGRIPSYTKKEQCAWHCSFFLCIRVLSGRGLPYPFRWSVWGWPERPLLWDSVPQGCYAGLVPTGCPIDNINGGSIQRRNYIKKSSASASARTLLDLSQKIPVPAVSGLRNRLDTEPKPSPGTEESPGTDLCSGGFSISDISDMKGICYRTSLRFQYQYPAPAASRTTPAAIPSTTTLPVLSVFSADSAS